MSPKPSAQVQIGSRIRTLRKRAALRLEDLAAKSGVSYQYLSGVENGKENFSIAVLERVAAALEVSLRSLIITAMKDPAAPPDSRE